MTTKLKWLAYQHPYAVDAGVKKMLYAIKDTKYVVKTVSYKEGLIFYILNSEEASSQLGYFTFARFGGAYNEILDMGDSENILKILDDYFKKPEPFVMDAPTQSPLSGDNDTSRESVRKFVANNRVAPREDLTPVNLSNKAGEACKKYEEDMQGWGLAQPIIEGQYFDRRYHYGYPIEGENSPEEMEEYEGLKKAFEDKQALKKQNEWKLPVFVALSSMRDRLSRYQMMLVLNINEPIMLALEDEMARLRAY